MSRRVLRPAGRFPASRDPNRLVSMKAMNRTGPATALLATLLAVTLAPRPAAQVAPPYGFEESFALADDRAALLERLVPGTEDDLFYRGLVAQQAGDLAGAKQVLGEFASHFPNSGRLEVLRNRQALLEFDTAPDGTFAFLRDRLDLRFDAQRERPDAAAELPTSLDPALVSHEALLARALARHPRSLDGFTPAGLSDFAAEVQVLRASGMIDNVLVDRLLGKLELPDVAGLAALVVDQLERNRGLSFGKLTIHRALTLAQLEECARLRPDLLAEPGFVSAWAQRLAPGADVDPDRDPAAREAWLDRLVAFGQRLPPVQVSFLAHALYHRLQFDRERGTWDLPRFLAYVKLPSDRPWARATQEAPVKRDAAWDDGLDGIGDDEPLVRDGVEHFLRDGELLATFAPWLDHDWLERTYAETCLLYGIGDQQAAAARLAPAGYEALEKRVEIRFAPGCPQGFGRDEPVALDLELKNVGTLLVKVFELDMLNVLSDPKRRIDAGIDLDGLVANEEQVLEVPDPPLRRVARRFEFPSLQGPGAWVVDFIGNGMSSRVVVRKGDLFATERSGAAGHVLTVRDETGAPCATASVRMDGREFPADAQGEVVIPFREGPRDDWRSVLLRDGRLVARWSFTHRSRQQELLAGFFVDRESLLPGRLARIVVRPDFRVDGAPASVSLLTDVRLHVTSVDRAGVSSTLDVPDFPLFDAGESVHEVAVPEDLAELRVGLSARAPDPTGAKPVELEAKEIRFPVSGIAAGADVAATLLERCASGWALQVRGRNGEPLPRQAVSVVLSPRDFTDALTVPLRTDEAGRIVLGELPEIASLTLPGLPEGLRAWDLSLADRTWPSVLDGVVGRVLRLPVPGWATARAGGGAEPLGTNEVPEAGRVSLIELAPSGVPGRDVFVADRFDHLRLAGGYLELHDLAAGDYRLDLKREGVSVRVRVTAGEARDGWLLGSSRILPASGEDPLQVTALDTEGQDLVVRLANAGEDARVLVLGTRYAPVFDAWELLRGTDDAQPDPRGLSRAPTDYASGRAISDEYRYILDRRHAETFPGNMLKRPSLLLNPWVLEPLAPGGAASAAGGGKFGAGGLRRASDAEGRADRRVARTPGTAPGTWPDVSFLPAPSAVEVDLRPGPDGTVRVPREQLGDAECVTVVALDSTCALRETLSLPPRPLVPVDRTLANSLDPAAHPIERRRIEVLDAGDAATIADTSTAQAEAVATLADVLRLFTTLTRDQALQEFSFLVRWPELSREERLEQYGKHACHELHLFLFEHDRAFFEEVVRPYLANKLEPGFLDDWLLGRDLSRWLEPVRWAGLNTLERILLARRVAEGQAAAATGGSAPNEPGVTVRALREALELVPPDPTRERLLFDTLLAGQALEVTASTGSILAGGRVFNEAMPAEARAQLEALGYVSADEDAGEGDFNLLSSAAGGPGPNAPANAPGVLSGRARREELAKDARRVVAQRPLYSQADSTRLLVESDWWHVRLADAGSGLVPVDPFWLDYAEWDGTSPFVSAHVAEATGSATEMLCALAALDLPFTAEAPEEHRDGATVRLVAKGPMLLVRRELLPAEPAADAAPVLVSESFCRRDDRYRWDGWRRLDKPVTGEFLAGVPYLNSVVVTNPTSTPRRLDLLMQVPRGAIALAGGRATRGLALDLAPFATQQVEQAFYFPAAGDFAHFPVQVAEGERLVGAAEARTLHVVSEPSAVDTTSWQHVSQDGTLPEVLAYLDGNNLERIDLGKLAWRLRDRPAFDAITGFLASHHAFDQATWSWSLYHRDAARARQYLASLLDFGAKCGRWLDSPLLRIDPVADGTDEHVEYEPLFNARAHRFAGHEDIPNGSIAATWADLIDRLAWKPHIDDGDRLRASYFLFLQDRVGEALEQFRRVDPDRLPSRIQYDYESAYAAFFGPDPEQARAIAQRYADHPAARWRDRFLEVIAQLDEASGQAPADSAVPPGDREARQAALAASEPSLELSVEHGQVVLHPANLGSVELRYYPMDVEFLFSTSPFLQEAGDSFASIRPRRTDTIGLAGAGPTVTRDLPEEFRNANVLVEARGAGLVRRQASYASALSVQVIEAWGQLKVTRQDTGQPLPGAYVKVYARMPGGAVTFRKDGYTDLRGRFDYASLSTDDLRPVEKYALLVLDELAGAVIREAEPPAR